MAQGLKVLDKQTITALFPGGKSAHGCGFIKLKEKNSRGSIKAPPPPKKNKCTA